MGFLNLGGGSGEYTPHIRYYITAPNFKISSPDGMKAVSLDQFVADFPNMRTGWGRYDEEQAPQWVYDAVFNVAGPRPSNDKDAQGQYKWKRGFSLPLGSQTTFGESPVRIWETTSTGAGMGVEALYGLYQAGLSVNAGKLPVCKFTGSVGQKVGKGNTAVPGFSIEKFIDRPEFMKTVPANQSSATPSPSVQKASVSEF